MKEKNLNNLIIFYSTISKQIWDIQYFWLMYVAESQRRKYRKLWRYLKSRNCATKSEIPNFAMKTRLQFLINDFCQRKKMCTLSLKTRMIFNLCSDFLQHRKRPLQSRHSFLLKRNWKGCQMSWNIFSKSSSLICLSILVTLFCGKPENLPRQQFLGSDTWGKCSKGSQIAFRLEKKLSFSASWV